MASILVIDDDQAIREQVKEMLQSAGHDVTEAAEGEDGLRKYRRRPSDVVVLDAFMPGLDGFATLRGLLKEDADVRVIGMSGGGRNPGLTQGALGVMKRLGAVRTLSKPFTRSELVAAVEKARKRRAREADRG